MKKDLNLFSKRYDVIVIGAGSGGLNVAGFMNKAGFKVLLIDKEDRAIGGDCLNHGCIPSKALIHVARLIRGAKQSERFGLSVSGVIDLKKVMQYVKDAQETIREHENAEYFRKQGMDVVLGTASFVDPNTVEVAGACYQGEKIVISTGSRPRKLSVPGIESVPIVYDNENIFSLDVLPKRMAIVGAGPIGIEIGQAFSALGTEVTVLGPTLLEKEDPEISAILQESLERDGVRLLLGYRPLRIADGKTVIARDDSGAGCEVPFDALLISIGRRLTTDGLNLKAAGIETNEKGSILVDDYLRTTNKNVLVCGDAVGGHQFTHAAELHAALIIRNFFSPFKHKLNTDSMAWVTYTSPEIATFGFDERTLKKRGISYELLTTGFGESDRAIVDEHTAGRIKLLVSPKGVVLGGSMVANNAGELAQELMLAQANQMNLKTLLKKVYPYPTATRVNRSLALSYAARSLTAYAKRILQILFH